RHGETGNIEMRIPMYNAIMIPQKATFEVLDKKYVFIVDKDNVIHSREITIAAEIPHVYIVQSGLEKTDRILLDGLRLVKENEKISFDFIQPLAALSNLTLYAE
ncbi:MAG: membrane fusion protein (multidrug efflux system), partial [Algoriphagus sp.]